MWSSAIRTRIGFTPMLPDHLRLTRRLGPSLPELGGEVRVLRGVHAALEHVQQRLEIVTHECGGVKPQAGKRRAAEELLLS